MNDAADSRAAMTQPSLHFRGIVLGPSGFAAQGREWLRLLDAAGLRPSLHGARLGDVEGGESDADRALIERCARRAPGPDRITVHHVLPTGFEPDRGARADVVVTVFETTSLPLGWGAHLDRADAVVVPTKEVAAAFAEGGVADARLHAIAPPVDLSGFAPGCAAWPGLPPRRPGTARLLSVFDWSWRKGIDVLLAAFGRAFVEHEAELLLKVAPRPGQDRDQLVRRCREVVAAHARGAVPWVYVLDELLPAEAIAGLYAGCDALVLPSRGEGWGRPVHEAMASAMPVIATRAGALATLLPDDSVGFPVASRVVPVGAEAVAETPCFRGQRWWQPDADDLERQLRRCVMAPAAARARGLRARSHIRALCDPNTILMRFCAVLDGVAGDAAERLVPLEGC